MASQGLKRPRSNDGGDESGTGSSSSGDDLLDRKCGFCNLGHNEGLEMATDFIDIPTDRNVWASDEPTLTHNRKPVWCHTNCVHFSPQTIYDETAPKCKWREVSKEYFRARCLSCIICEEKGASIGCRVSSCNASVHFPCAIKEFLPDGRKNWYPCQESELPYFCPKHFAQRSAHEQDKEIARLSDLSQGNEPYPIPLEMGLALATKTPFHSALASPGTANGKGHGGGGGGGGAAAVAAAAAAAEEDQASAREQWQKVLPEVPLPRGLLTKPRDIDFTYVAATVDSKSAQVRQGPEREKRCCTCTGPATCRDPRTCECLRQGRQYSSKGRLIDEGHPAQIYECNVNCRCHVDDCRNRLVQRGMTCNIKVLYLGSSRRRVLEGCGKWGVTAVREIPARSFVCTVAGQLVLAGDMVGSVDQQGQHSTSVLVHRVRDWTERDFRQTHHQGGSSSNGRGVDSGGSTSGSSSSSSSSSSGGSGSSSVGGGTNLFRVQPARPPLAGGPQERFVDQRRYANISRYIRCARRLEDANLVPVAVHTAYQDPNAPVLALFAVKTIEEGTELLRYR